MLIKSFSKNLTLIFLSLLLFLTFPLNISAQEGYGGEYGGEQGAAGGAGADYGGQSTSYAGEETSGGAAGGYGGQYNNQIGNQYPDEFGANGQPPPTAPPGNFDQNPPVPYCDAVNLTAVHLSWTPSQYAIGYNVFWMDTEYGIVHGPTIPDGQGDPFLHLPDSTRISYNIPLDIPLAPGRSYSFMIESYNGYGYNHTNPPDYWSHVVWGFATTTLNCGLPQPFTLSVSKTCSPSPATVSTLSKSTNATHYDFYRYNVTDSVFDPAVGTYQLVPADTFMPPPAVSRSISLDGINGKSYNHWASAYNMNIAWLFADPNATPNYFIYSNNPDRWGKWDAPQPVYPPPGSFPAFTTSPLNCNSPAISFSGRTVTPVGPALTQVQIPSGQSFNLDYTVTYASSCIRSVTDGTPADANWVSTVTVTPQGPNTTSIEITPPANGSGNRVTYGYKLECTNPNLSGPAATTTRTVLVDVCPAVPAKLKTTGGSVHSNNQIIGPSSSGC